MKTLDTIGIKPRPDFKQLRQALLRDGKPCILHSCGNLRAVMEDLIVDVGIDAKHSYEDVIMSVTEAKQLYGRRITILGGFDVDRLCRSAEPEIRDYVDFLVDRLGQDGGYALGSGNSIADYVPLEHYLTMLEQGWKRR